jgi:hypothetical protein
MDTNEIGEMEIVGRLDKNGMRSGVRFGLTNGSA